MSERKVLSKYYPPDFDPRQLQRRATKGAGPCGEYIGKGRKFNARKSTPDEKYLGIQIFRFFIRCTRCSSEITFRTDPQTSDYVCEAGTKRNTELWWSGDAVTETVDERLDRLEREEQDHEGTEKDAMADLERETHSAETRMAVADALDEVRSRNARVEKRRGKGLILWCQPRKAERLQRTRKTSRMRGALSPPAQRRKKRAAKQTKLLPGLKRTDAPSSRLPLVNYGSDTD
ncbi:mRNA splicing protein yju2 [Colletotrichum plurivorum]|uniref:mRNA splicing protein yju2 n=1 Tax=Colletotrichum plurivorum TaxID=2175906 RepID=A0A8H6KC58_9PEZI|nr:mRNA splicing protein yju2 [Colletotrichum plurivorum]